MDNVDIKFDYKGETNKIKTKKPLIFENIYNFKDKNLLIKKGLILTKGVNVEYKGEIKNLFNIKEIEP